VKQNIYRPNTLKRYF